MRRFSRFSSSFPTVGALGLAAAAVASAHAQSFTYQGALKESGAPANGTYDLQFSLFKSEIAGTQIGSTITQDDVSVADGLLAAQLDFGPAAFDGGGRWLEITVNGTPLAPRTEVTPAPMAIYAMKPWSSNAGSIFYIGGNVGIGTNLPSAKLDVSGVVKAAGFTLTTGAGDGMVLMSDAAGVGTWSDLAALLQDNSITDAMLQSIGWSKITSIPGGLGGSDNVVSGPGSVVPGGSSNRAQGNAAVVGGGDRNAAGSDGATVGGGSLNTASASLATIAGGQSNTASAYAAAVGGGLTNRAERNGATVAGGLNNAASGLAASVGGGQDNTASGDYATVGGGLGSTASLQQATVAGGLQNLAGGFAGTVGGGQNNSATGPYAAIAGGEFNTASALHSIVAGGSGNDATGQATVVGGGQGNLANGLAATVAGGNMNVADGSGATAGGGEGNSASDHFATVGGGQTNLADGMAATVGGGTLNQASQQTATVSGGQENTASAITAAVGGGFSNTASGVAATVAGGHMNTAGAQSAVVAGGQENSASGVGAAVGGGVSNDASEQSATIAGGQENTASDQAAAVGGGYLNTAEGPGATIPGGVANFARGFTSFAAGNRAHADHDGSFVWADNTDADFVSTGVKQFLIRAAGGVRLGLATFVDFGFGVVGREPNAGKIGYALFTPDTLDIVGAGTTAPSRKVKVFAEGGTTFTGNINVNGTNYTSDRRFKTDIVTIDNALDTISELRGVTFDWDRERWKDRGFAAGKQIGFIAQEVEEVLPELVNTDADGYKSVAYANVVPVLVEAVKTLKQQNDATTRENEELKSRLDFLEKAVQQLASQSK